MSANMNGAVHLSIFDGWTVEGTFNGINGYTVEYEGLDDEMPWEERHWKDHECVMNIIENEIIPTYYDNKEEWARLVRQSMRTAEAYFNSDRMVIEYYNRLYKPIAHDDSSTGTEKIWSATAPSVFAIKTFRARPMMNLSVPQAICRYDGFLA